MNYSYLYKLKSKINELELKLQYYINKSKINNNNLIDDELTIVGTIFPIGESDINGVFTVSKNDSSFTLKKTVVTNLNTKSYTYTGYALDNFIIFHDDNYNQVYKMNSNYSVNFKHKIDTPEIDTNKLKVAGELRAMGDANMNGIFTVSRDINGQSDLILKKTTQTNDGNQIKLYNGKINGAKIIFTDNNNNSVYIMGTPKSLIISHKLEVPSINIGNSKKNINGSVMSLYGGSKDDALIDFLDNAGGRNTYLQGNKNQLYTPSNIKTDSSVIANKVIINDLQLNNPKKGSYITHLRNEIPKECKNNEYVCGMGSNYYGSTVIGTSMKCCKFDNRG
jgi:hypothetical protein